MLPFYREFTSQALIDAQYNPALKLPDPGEPARQYAAMSARARQCLPAVLDVPFGPTRAETLDIFPAHQPGAPVFVYLHGGYWRAYGARDFSFVAAGLQPLGVTTVVVNYALCPYVTLDEVTRQVRAAVAWTIRQVGAYGADASRLAIGGHSAGAHLTAMCLQTAWQRDYGLPDDPFAAALLISGVYDISPLRYSYLQPLIQLDDGTVRRNSPLFSVRACATPVWANWGSEETPEFRRQANAFHQAWQAAGNPGELSALGGADHFTGVHGLENPQSSLSQWVAGKLGAIVTA